MCITDADGPVSVIGAEEIAMFMGSARQSVAMCRHQRLLSSVARAGHRCLPTRPLVTLGGMAAQSPLIEMPLFPLSAVLFPGGQLQLRIFEPRYIDLVRECTRYGTGFGLCLILDGQEAGLPATPAAIGTVARINDFDRGDDGLLGIVADGGKRFRVARSRVRSDGLLRGDVELWPDEPELQVPVEFALLQSILERLIETMAPHWRHAPRSAYEDASWLGLRLAELLPLSSAEQQHMLELNDPVQRLGELRDITPDLGLRGDQRDLLLLRGFRLLKRRDRIDGPPRWPIVAIK